MKNMTKKGYLNKFFITLVVVAIGAYILVGQASGGSLNASDTFVAMIAVVGIPVIIASAVVALLWEFFST